jgi:rhamnose transport system permease protein
MTRFSVELGLLAVALTPVIVAGGIDLSVGLDDGARRRDFGAAYHAPASAVAGWRSRARCWSVLPGGALNALLIARLKLPALIVTLGNVLALSRVAEGLTPGGVNYTGFPSGFLFLGQGYLGGLVPTQLRCSC